MAISTPSQIIASGNVTNQGTYDTAVVALTAGRLYILQVVGYASGGSALPSSVTHNPGASALAFTNLTDGTDTASHAYETNRHHSLWYVVPGATTASALIRIIFPGTQSSCGWRLVEITSGFATGGGSTTFNLTAGASGTGTAIAATMAAFSGTDALTILFIAWGSSTSNPTQTIAPTESRTELGEHNDGERQSCGCHYQNPNGNDTSVGATLSASNTWSIFALEVKATAVAADTSLVVPRPDRNVYALDASFDSE